MNTPRSPLPPVAILGAAALALAVMGPDRGMLAVAMAPWVLFWLAFARLWVAHREWLGRPLVLLGGAVILRVVFFVQLPDLSDDLYRYVWDGMLGMEGIRPYEMIPADPALARFHHLDLYRSMNSPEYISVYPPLSQWIFLLGGWAWGIVGWPGAAWAVKAGFLLMEGIGVGFLYLTLRKIGHPVSSLALYAWNPLVLLTLAGSGHTEGGFVLGVGILLYGVAHARSRKGAWLAWAGWGFAVLSKGIPLILAPLVWRAVGTRDAGSHTSPDRSRETVATRAIAPAVVLGAMAAVSLPFLRPSDLGRIATSASLYVGLFEFNAGLYYTLQAILSASPAAGLAAHLGSILGAIFLLGAILIVMRHAADSTGNVARAMLLVFTLYLVVATTVHPWYLAWVLPFLPFTSTLRVPWLWASAAAFPTYLTYVGVSHALLTTIFWGGWFVLALHDRREWVLGPLRRLAGRRKARWIEPWLSGDQWLDVGGAEGWVSRNLALRNPDRTGGIHVVDPMAGRSTAGSGWSSQVRGDGARLPFRDDSAGTVILSFVLHHSDEPDRILAEAIRVAGDRVVLLETTPRTRPGARALGIIDRWVNGTRGDGSMGRWGAPIQYRTGEGWARAVEDLGGRVLLRDRPGRIGHPVTRLVVSVPSGPGVLTPVRAADGRVRSAVRPARAERLGGSDRAR